MALDKLQKLPSASDHRAYGLLSKTVAALLSITLLDFWAATQWAAWKLAFQPALGEPLARFANWNLYWPHEFFLWWLTYGHVEGTGPAFDGGLWFLAALAFLFVPAIALAIARANRLNVLTDTHGSARWATKEDIHEATLLARPPTPMQALQGALPAWARTVKVPTAAGARGCYVGAWVDPKTDVYHYLTHDGPEHILAFAPTRSGKGVGLVLPTLLSWQHSTLIHDLKGEAWALTAGYRKAKGHVVLRFEPSNPDGTSARYNPLNEVRLRTLREVADAQNIAQMIVDPDGKGMSDHWAKTGHELLSAGILHVLYAGKSKTLRGLVSFFCDPSQSLEQVAEAMLNYQHDHDDSQGWVDANSGRPTRVHPMVAEAARSFLNKSENERSGVQSTAMSFLSLYRDPIVAKNTAVSDFKVSDLMNHDKPVSLYMVIPPNDQDRLRPLTRLLVNQILSQCTEKMDFKDGRSVAGYKHRLLVLLDEAASLKRLPILETSLAHMAGYGLKAYLIFQDLTQLMSAYGKDESVLSNCHIRIAYAPNKVETAELLSKYCGVTTIRIASQSYSGKRLNPFLSQVSASEQQTQRALLTADECLRLPGPVKSADGSKIEMPGDMLILPAGANPIYGKQILYFKDPVFDGRSKIPPPKESDRLQLTEAPAAAPAVVGPIEQAMQVPAATQQAAPAPTTAVAPAPVVLAPAAAAAVAISAAAASAGAAAPDASATGAAYTAEELAQLDAEADDEEAGADSEVEAQVRADTSEAQAAAEPAAEASAAVSPVAALKLPDPMPASAAESSPLPRDAQASSAPVNLLDIPI